MKQRRRRSVEWRGVVVERGLKTEMTSGKAMILIAPIILPQSTTEIGTGFCNAFLTFLHVKKHTLMFVFPRYNLKLKIFKYISQNTLSNLFNFPKLTELRLHVLELDLSKYTFSFLQMR